MKQSIKGDVQQKIDGDAKLEVTGNLEVKVGGTTIKATSGGNVTVTAAATCTVNSPIVTIEGGTGDVKVNGIRGMLDSCECASLRWRLNEIYLNILGGEQQNDPALPFG